jgi:hypothetical protein
VAAPPKIVSYTGDTRCTRSITRGNTRSWMRSWTAPSNRTCRIDHDSGAQSRFALTPPIASGVEQICRRPGGIPPGLERVLAADVLLASDYLRVQRFRVALHDLDVTVFKHWLLDPPASELGPFPRLVGTWLYLPPGSCTMRSRKGP